ncbi:MAG: MFS transporter [Patescibacteria group bacterium]
MADKNVPDIWFNLCLATSSAILLLTAPFVGIKLDEKWQNISGLRVTTIAIIFFYGLTAFFALKNYAVPALAFFTIGQYFFALSFSFYTPLINVISPPNKRGLVSGIGFVGNFMGNIAGLLLAAPFATGKINLFGELSRAETIVPAISAFLLFSLPMLLFFKEPKKENTTTQLEGNFLQKATSIFQNRNILIFLISFSLFNGAILTVINNLPIIFEKVWNTTDNTKALITLATVIASVIGSFLFGHFADRFGDKKILVLILISWIVLLPVTAIMLNFYYFVICCIISGLFIGANATVSRTTMTNLATNKNYNLGFSYFNIIERASIIIGPIIWGTVVSSFTSFGIARYQFALLAMALIVFSGLIFLLKKSRPFSSG